MDEEEESNCSRFVTRMKLISLCPKFSMEACPQMKYELVVQRTEGHFFSYHVPKRSKVEKKIDF